MPTVNAQQAGIYFKNSADTQHAPTLRSLSNTKQTPYRKITVAHSTPYLKITVAHSTPYRKITVKYKATPLP